MTRPFQPQQPRNNPRGTDRLLVALATAPLGLVVVHDVAVRWARMVSWDSSEWLCYGASLCISAVFWGAWVVLVARTTRRTAWIVAAMGTLLASLMFGAPDYFYSQYMSYPTVRALVLGLHVSSSVANQLRADWANAARVILLPGLVFALLVLFTRRLVRIEHHGRSRLVSTGVLLLAGASLWFAPACRRPSQPASVDHLFVNGMRGLQVVSHGGGDGWKHPKNRAPMYLPALRSSNQTRRNVLLVIDESVRADVVCSVPTDTCPTTPRTNRAAPHRIGLPQLRSNDSTTAISLAVLWSGVSPLVTVDDWKKTPLLFDFAHAAGWSTGFISSQDLTFADTRALLNDVPLDVFVEAKDLAPDHNIDIGAPDELTAQRAVRVMSSLRQPFLMVVQFSNVHFPYRVDPHQSPFQPSTDSKDPAKVAAFFNYYRNAVFLHDQAVAKLIEGLRASPAGPNTVVVYTSDHGEAFREHHQLGHTLSIFDEEIHVPGWVDAPGGTLSRQERSVLQASARGFTWHVDIAPTVLDLMGLLDDPGLSRYRRAMGGTSWLRGNTSHAVPIDNCAAMWGCAFKNWGLMRGHFKLEARQWDRQWHCFDLSVDPKERSAMSPSRCGDLSDKAQSLFGGLPHDAK